MKVILLAPTPPPMGGIASWTVRMQRAKLKNNWKVDVVDEKVIGSREVFGDNVRMDLITEVKRVFGIWKNLRIKLKDPDVCVVHSCVPAGRLSMLRELGCLIITKWNKKKFIIHYRCTIPNMVKDHVTLMIFRLLSDFSDAIITLNTPSKDFSENNCKTPVYLIPNFVENSAINQNVNRAASKELKTVVYIGGVITSKGCLEIIEASKHFPNIEFRLVGKASTEVTEVEMLDNVVLLGEQNKDFVQAELEKADIFVFPSYFDGEGFSNSLVEAMAQGLPCIVSDWAANADMIEGKGGIVIPIKDSNALVNAIEKLKDSILRQSMIEWNINKVLMCYNENAVTSSYVDLYEEISK